MLVNNWRFWVALAVSTLFMLLLLYQVDLGEIRIALLEANYLYVAPAIALYFVAFYFRSLRWKYLLSPMRTFPVSRLYPVIVIGYMSNNLLPAR
ncbi:MAG: lysylphosphatidylglycerol synthase domain-containing protein, partial [Chloroflexota bacterium]|nr:lysylphosphatidylglycerol synthase domain-containing protein [Chloroflexota bacterium]